MDLTQVPQINAKVSEYQRTVAALDNLAKGGRIAAFMVAAPAAQLPPDAPSNMPPPAVMITTEYIDYPPQMTEAIKAILAARRDQLDKELTDVGVVTEPDTQRKGK